MVSSSEFSDTGTFAGQKLERLPEKTMFTQTCSLLRDYLKEKKGSFGELNLGMALGSVDGNASNTDGTPRNLMPMDLFHHQSDLSNQIPMQDFPQMVNHSMIRSDTTEPEKSQMTIFYAGQVLVFNDFPANKAKELMLVASMASANTKVPSSTINTSQEWIHKTPLPMNMPIARKASLARFLEKRKDRINARAPYDVNNAFAAPSKPNENKSWLGLSG